MEAQQLIIDNHDARLAVLEQGQRELAPAMARVEAQLEAVATTVARIDAKLDAHQQALEAHKTEDAGTALKVHDLEVEQKRRDEKGRNVQYALWTAVAGVLVDLVLHLITHFKV